jgi:indole-3-glycerol phosphate synthase
VTFSATYLDDIISYHRARASNDTRVWQDRISSVRFTGPSFFDAIASTNNPCVKVIAEIKRRSPSKGWLSTDLDPAVMARVYQQAGATAISVLTDGPHFAGSLADLREVRNVASLPLLRKDFTVSANDVIDAAASGAAAVLLIMAALSDEEVALFSHIASLCGIDCLVEVHDEVDLRRAIDAGAMIIGINQRDLRTFEVDPGRATSLVEQVPPDVLTVAESGITSLTGVQAAASARFNAVLVGEAFVRSPDPASLVMEFSSVPLRN